MFFIEISEICKKNDRVAFFIDMDGTIVEYKIYDDENMVIKAHENLLNEKPIFPIINELRKLNEIENLDLYILSLSKTSKIKEQKKIWLKKYLDFIDEENFIILDKELGEYNSENRNYIKSKKIEEKLKEYNFAILLDDDHKILKRTKMELKDKCEVFHISSALI